MPDITTVPELRRLVDEAKKQLGESWLASYELNRALKASLRAMLTALEAAEEHENTVAALSQMTPEAARADGMYQRVTDTSLTLSSVLAPLFPKEATDERPRR